jgi:hypothetical protein
VHAPQSLGVARGAGRDDVVRQFYEWSQRGRRLEARDMMDELRPTREAVLEVEVDTCPWLTDGSSATASHTPDGRDAAPGSHGSVRRKGGGHEHHCERIRRSGGASAVGIAGALGEVAV